MTFRISKSSSLTEDSILRLDSAGLERSCDVLLSLQAGLSCSLGAWALGVCAAYFTGADHSSLTSLTAGMFSLSIKALAGFYFAKLAH